MSKFNGYANDLLDAQADTGASGTLALGPVSARSNYTLPFKVELTTTVSTASTPGTPFSGGSYAAQSIAGSMAAAATRVKASNAALTYSSMPAGTWADAYLRDSTGTPKPMLFRGGTTLGKTVNVGDTCLIPAGSLSFNED